MTTDRSRSIGASEVAAVLGIDPRTSPMDIWLRKTGRHHDDGEGEGVDPTIRMGHLLEDDVVELYEDGHPNLVVEETHRYVHPLHPWATATPDRVVNNYGPESPPEPLSFLLECKTVTGASERWGNQPPDYVLVQCCWQMFVTDLPRVDVAALFWGLHYEEYTVLRDPELEQAIFERVERFWREHVLADVPPPFGGSTSETQWLRRSFPRAMDETMLDVDGQEILETLRNYQRLKAELERVSHDKLAAENTLRAVIGEHLGIKGPWGTAKWINVAGSVDWKRYAEANLPTDDKATAPYKRASHRMLRVTINREYRAHAEED